MKGVKAPFGYTIIEVMIVLAVSGFMFLIAATFISGKEEKASFTQGVNEMSSRVQDIIGQVNDGQYSDILLNCQFTGGKTTFPGGSNAQGTNSGCVFLGKVLHLSEGSASDNYEIFLLAGGRVSGNNPITNLASADVKVIDNPSSLIADMQIVPQSLNISNVTISPNCGASSTSYGIAFMQSQGSLDSVTGDLQNGTQSVAMYCVQNLNAHADQTSAIALVNGGSNLLPAQSADICLTDDLQYAEIIIGSNNNQLTVDVKRDNTTKPPTC